MPIEQPASLLSSGFRAATSNHSALTGYFLIAIIIILNSLFHHLLLLCCDGLGGYAYVVTLSAVVPSCYHTVVKQLSFAVN